MLSLIVDYSQVILSLLKLSAWGLENRDLSMVYLSVVSYEVWINFQKSGRDKLLSLDEQLDLDELSSRDKLFS